MRKDVLRLRHDQHLTGLTPTTLAPFPAGAARPKILPAHEDPADRFLVATALIYELTLDAAGIGLTSLRNGK